MKKLQLLLADDHQVVREGLRLLVNAQPDMRVLAEASDGKEALQKAEELQPDVLVIDLVMPEMDGLQVTETLKNRCPNIKVLVLTAHEDENSLRQSYKAKAEGYVLKSSTGSELLRAIRDVAQGGVHFDATLVGKTLLRENAPDQDAQRTAPSEREKSVLILTARGYSNKEIASQLSISVKTVETYKMRLGEKLKLRSRSDIVRYALRRGWLTES
ncbi:MAG: response regulator transcription factor [Candidatus Omnitrophica bacterium]|nr:response regulator transcription factor [Candidatus Omnitrophota bacterium]